MSDYKIIGASVLIPHVGSMLSSSQVSEDDIQWYQNLRKPSWCPPQYVFAPMWGIIHTSMGYAAYLIWKESQGFNRKSILPLSIYASTLSINWAWAPTFFTGRSLKWAWVESFAMWGTGGACVFTFASINRQAGLLMTPYFAWITLATALVFRFWRDNISGDAKEGEEEKGYITTTD